MTDRQTDRLNLSIQIKDYKNAHETNRQTDEEGRRKRRRRRGGQANNDGAEIKRRGR